MMMDHDSNPNRHLPAAYWRAAALALAQQLHDEAGPADRLIACLFPTNSALAIAMDLLDRHGTAAGPDASPDADAG